MAKKFTVCPKQAVTASADTQNLRTFVSNGMSFVEVPGAVVGIIVPRDEWMNYSDDVQDIFSSHGCYRGETDDGVVCLDISDRFQDVVGSDLDLVKESGILDAGRYPRVNLIEF